MEYDVSDESSMLHDEKIVGIVWIRSDSINKIINHGCNKNTLWNYEYLI